MLPAQGIHRPRRAPTVAPSDGALVEARVTLRAGAGGC